MATGLLAPFGIAKVPQTIGCQTAYAASMQIYKMIGDAIDAVKVIYMGSIVGHVGGVSATPCGCNALYLSLLHGFN